MNLGRQIHTLLKRQSSVYVNRLGTFKRIHTPATFDAKRHVFLPPITYVEFDRDTDDGYDFVTYVQQAQQLERGEAELVVEQAVSVLLDKLNQLGNVSLDNLGQLVSYGNSYVFKPLDLSGFNYTPVEDQFHAGDGVSTTPVGQEVPTATDSAVSEGVISEEPDGTLLESETFPAVEESAGVGEEPLQEDMESETVERKSTSAYVYALVAVLAVSLLGGLYYYSTYIQHEPTVAKKQEKALVPADTLSQDTLVDMPPIDSLALTKDTTATPSPEKKEEVVPPVNHKYTIVIGTHRTLAQAYEEAEAFNKDGHKSVRVITPNLAKNLKRVVWDTYPTKEERDSALRYVKKHIKTDAWPDVIR